MNCFNQPALQPCPACGTPLQVEIFPRCFVRSLQEKPASQLWWMANQAAFTIRKKRPRLFAPPAVVFFAPCAICELGGQHLCPACLEAGKQKGKIKSLENHRTLYDSMALALAVYPLLIFYFTIITAPAALFVAIRHWNSPSSIIPRTKIRFVVAIVIALVELAGWGVGVYS